MDARATVTTRNHHHAQPSPRATPAPRA